MKDSVSTPGRGSEDPVHDGSFVHVRQDAPHECFACSLAMFLSTSKERVFTLGERLSVAWNEPWKRDEPMPTGLARVICLHFRKTVVTFSELPLGVPAMVVMPSDNPAWMHVVYLSPDGRLYDPLKPEPIAFDPDGFPYVEAHVRLRDLAPWFLRDSERPSIAAWPEIEAGIERAHRSAESLRQSFRERDIPLGPLSSEIPSCKADDPDAAVGGPNQQQERTKR